MHHTGRRPKQPAFELRAQPASEVVIHDDAQAATLTSGRLSVRVAKAGDWRIEFKDGERLITSSGWRGMGIIDTPQERYIHEQLARWGRPSRCAGRGRLSMSKRVLLRDVSAIPSATGAAAVDDALGTLLTPEPGTSGLSVRLAS